MKIQGTYKNFEAETFTIELSYQDLVNLDIEMNLVHGMYEDQRSRVYRVAKLIAKAIDEKDFGFAVTTIRE